METREELEARAAYWVDEWNGMRIRKDNLFKANVELQSTRRKIADLCIIFISGSAVAFTVGYILLGIWSCLPPL